MTVRTKPPQNETETSSYNLAITYKLHQNKGEPLLRRKIELC